MNSSSKEHKNTCSSSESTRLRIRQHTRQRGLRRRQQERRQRATVVHLWRVGWRTSLELIFLEHPWRPPSLFRSRPCRRLTRAG